MVEKFAAQDAKNGNFNNQMESRRKSNKKRGPNGPPITLKDYTTVVLLERVDSCKLEFMRLVLATNLS